MIVSLETFNGNKDDFFNFKFYLKNAKSNLNNCILIGSVDNKLLEELDDINYYLRDIVVKDLDKE
jgi:hypothetical protein